MDIVGREVANTPPVTSVYIGTCILLTAAVLYFNPSLIVTKFQIWRLITSYCFFGTFSFNFLFNILFAYRYSRMLEETWYSTKTADFVMMFLFCITLTSIIAVFVHIIFLSHVLTMMLVYVWSRRNPFVRLNIFGVIDVNAPYLPWVFLAFAFLLASGIVVGHLYYFLEDVFPEQQNGFRILRTPQFIRPANRAYDPLPEADRPGGFEWGADGDH